MTTVEGDERNKQIDGTLGMGVHAGDANAPNQPSDPEYFTADPPNSDDVIDCLYSAACQMNAAALHYNYLGPNSNRAVVEMMDACGLTVKLTPRAVGWKSPFDPWR